MSTTILERLVGGFVWQPARINVRSPHASATVTTETASRVLAALGLKVRKGK